MFHGQGRPSDVPLLRGTLDSGATPDGKGPRKLRCFDCEQPDPIRTEKVTGWLKGELQPPK